MFTNLSRAQSWMMMIIVLVCYSDVANGKYESVSDTNLLNGAAMVNEVLQFTYAMEQWLDTSQQPCNNFFDYVCARSINNSQQDLDRRREQQQMKFERFLNGSSHISIEQLMDAELKLKYFYESCQQERSADNLKSTLMYRSVGGWPAIDDTMAMLRKRHSMTWLHVLSVFHEAGVPSYFFKTKIQLFSNRRLLQIEPDESVRFSLRKFEQLAANIMEGYEVDVGRARLVALEVLHFERASRDIMNDNATTTTTTTQESQAKGLEDIREFSYEDFKSKAFALEPQLDWDDYFRKTLGKSLRDTDLVYVKDIAKLNAYFELLQNTTITRFLNWLWLDYLMDKTENDCRKLSEEYFKPVYQHIIERSSLNRVHMAQMYSDLNHMYDQLLYHTPWIDELTQQFSKLFSSRIIHLTLNGDASMDKDYEQLIITPRNFYRNLEKIQRFLTQSHKIYSKRTPQQNEVIRTSDEFMKIFLIVNGLLGSKQNLSAPLNYMMVGEHFSEMMIGGGSFRNPGSWRSMDSEEKYSKFEKCLERQEIIANAATKRRMRYPRKSVGQMPRAYNLNIDSDAEADIIVNKTTRNFHLNDLILKMLAQQLTWQSYQQWLHKERAVEQRLDALLKAGRLQMSLRKLYFILTVLVDCQRNPLPTRRQFVNAYLRNSPAFSQTFKCQRYDKLSAVSKCKIL